MADAEAGTFAGLRRPGAVTAAAVVLTIDAVVLLLITLLGVPFLAFFFGDEHGGWQQLWPLFTGWFVAALLAAVCSAAAVRFAGIGTYDAHRAGIAAAIGTTVASGAFAIIWFPGSPLLALAAITVAGANLAAACALRKPGPAAMTVDRFPVHRPATVPAVAMVSDRQDRAGDVEPGVLGGAGSDVQVPAGDVEPGVLDGVGGVGSDVLAAAGEPGVLDGTGGVASGGLDGPGDVETESDRAGEREAEAVRHHPTLDLEVGPTRAARASTAVRKRHPRGQAALRTMAGVRLPRRASTRAGR